MENVYEELAQRNKWEYNLQDGRPYFLKDGKYAVPDENTTIEDKELLANILSEGSDEMAKLILDCWDNNIGISGPCSGIEEFHNEHPFALHFTFIAPKKLIKPLYDSIRTVFPDFDYMYREQNNEVRYDINYMLEGKILTKEQSNEIFSVIREQLEAQLNNNKTKQL